MPRLMGASTLLLVFSLLAVNVTIVPSGTGLPEQSRTGSVSTTMPLEVRWPLMRRLHGSDATCCTARREVTALRAAFTCRMPVFFPELVRNHAIPLSVRTARDMTLEFPEVSWKLTSYGAITRLWN